MSTMRLQGELFSARRRRAPRVPGKAAGGTERSLKWLRERGYRAAKVEHYKFHVDRDEQGKLILRSGRTGMGHREDLFGLFDILAFHPLEPGVLAVQTTSREQIGTHLSLYRSDPQLAAILRDWLAQPGRQFSIHGWQPTGKKAATGRLLVRWELTVRVIEPKDLIEEPF